MINRTNLLYVIGAVVLCVANPSALSGQLFTPTYLAPMRSSDVGVYLSDGLGGRGGLAVEGIWRRGYGAYDLGVRAGAGEVREAAVLLLGGEYRRALALGTEPLALAATGGAQAVLGGESGFGVDVGLTVGSRFVLDGVALTPYLHPRVGISRAPARASSGVGIFADLGADIEFAPNLILRVGIGFGEESARLGVGLAWR